MPENSIHIGNHTTQASGNVDITSNGERTTVSANGLMGALLLTAAKQASLQCGTGILSLDDSIPDATNLTFQAGPAGSITIGLGPMELGARIELKPGELEIAVGPPVAGASIKMTPASISLQVAENAYEITPLGIEEKVVEITTRSATPMGHEFKSAESSYQLNPAGESVSVPTSDNEVLTTGDVKAAAESALNATGMGQVNGSIVMIN